MSETPPLSQTTPRLELGPVAPGFKLPAVQGGELGRGDYRGRRHLAIIFLPAVDLPAREYLTDLAGRYGAVCDLGSEVLAIVTDPGANADGLKAALDLPFPLLLDRESKAASRYLPDGASHGVFILDRYGALRHQWTLTAPPLPPVDELIAWLQTVDYMCVL